MTWATLYDVIAGRADDAKVGLSFDDKQWTWAEVVAEGATRAAALNALLPKPADRDRHVGILLHNEPDFCFWLAAAGLAGATAVGINATRTASELADDIRHAEIDVLVAGEDLAHLLVGDHGVPDERVLVVGTRAYDDFLAPHRGAGVPTEAPDPESLALLMFSSGSTGAPKAVIATQGRLGPLTEAMSGRTRIRRDSVTYLCMPLYHGNAILLNFLPAAATGARIRLVRKFSASRFSGDVAEHQITYFNYVGRALSYVLAQPVDPRDADSTLELAFGTEASEADALEFAARFGCEVEEGYGQSEGVFRINRTADSPPGALGMPAGGVDVRVLNEDTGTECPRAEFDAHGRLLNPEAIGQMVAIGKAHAFNGYYKNPSAMADRLRFGGEDFWSGDLAYRDAAGQFFFAGRSNEWLRVDGENLSAGPIERVIARMPGVASAVVYAIADPATGDQVMCTLELAPGASFDSAAFGEFLAAQADMATKWWPTFVRVIDRIPLTGSNKVNKAPLRAAAWYTDDPVFHRASRSREYVEFTDADRDARVADFIAHGRGSHLPATAPAPSEAVR